MTDYIDSYSSPVLYNEYKTATAGCYYGAAHDNALCFKHILADMLDLTLYHL